MFGKVLNTLLDDTTCENQMFFIVLPIIRNQSKTRTIPHTVLGYSLTTILETKLETLHGGLFELEMLEIFTRTFVIKNHYWDLKLSIVALTSAIKCYPLKMIK